MAEKGRIEDQEREWEREGSVMEANGQRARRKTRVGRGDRRPGERVVEMEGGRVSCVPGESP